MKTFAIHMKKNRVVHVTGIAIDITQEGFLIIIGMGPEMEEYLVGLFKEWDCCVAVDSVTLSMVNDDLDE